MKPHPWGDFLKARYYAILWMREEMYYSDERIAHDLSMDTMQVFLIRTKKPFWEISEEKKFR